MTSVKKFNVAIACQGGGSHTAFTAGALIKILRKLKKDDFNIVALSGTSGGAICAFLAWYGLLKNDVELAETLLRKFWEKNSINTPWDAVTNSAVMIAQSQKVHMDLSPYCFPEWGRYMLKSLLEDLVDVDIISSLIQKNSPKLFVGAVDVCSGSFRIFTDQEVTVDALLASAAIPTIFRAAPVGEDYYWDGLFSHNPPVRNLAKVKPDKLWVIQINPPNRSEVPKTVEEIRDRRNELAGNLSLEQELYFINQVNDFVSHGKFKNGDYKDINVKKAIMKWDLPYVTKLDRNPQFIRKMMVYGEKQAEQFFV